MLRNAQLKTKIMKKIFLTIGMAVSIGLNALLAQKDTLNVIFEFDSPTSNPWGLAFDGTSLWISDHENGQIFKATSTGQILDSIEIKNTKITGIAFVNDTLWTLNTEIAEDTIINTSTYPIYNLYQVDKSNGNKIDSIKIIGSVTTLNSGDFWGLEYLKGKFYISYNGGWGPCLIEVDKAGVANELCCTHLVGMTVVSDSIWAIRQGGDMITTTNGTNENWKYRINCSATDIAFDGTHFWIVDTIDHKIKKLEAISTTSIEDLSVNDQLKIYPNPTTQYLTIHTEGDLDIHSVMIFDMNGRIVDPIFLGKDVRQDIDISHLTKGVYFITISFTNERITKRFIKE